MTGLIVLAGALLRLFRISVNATFLGEQGRDLIIAKNILEGKLTLLGPPTSISNVHFGPFYHYFNAFFLYLFKLDPLGPAVGFCLISILSIYLLYQIGKNLKNKTAGLIAATLFAFSPLMIEYGQTMFNSHFITGFTIFSLWAVSNYLKNKKIFWLIFSGFFAGVSFQANFLSFGIFLGLISLLFLEKTKLKKIFFSFLGFLIGILPYLIFELRHQFFNLKAFLFLVKEGKAIGGTFFSFPACFFSNYFKSVDFLSKPASLYFSIAFFILVLGSLLYLSRSKTRKNILFKIILVFTFFELLVVSLYPGQMLQHYLGAVYPFIFLLFGLCLQEVLKKKFGIYFLLFMGMLTAFNLSKFDFKRNQGYGMPENWKIKDVKTAGEIIAREANGQFNVAAILDGDTRAYPYRYIIETKGKIPMAVEQYPNAESLYVVAKTNQDVLNYPVWEIQSILPATIENQWPVTNEVSVYKLIKI